MNDLKFAFRQVLKSPGVTALAVLSLALGIAANTTIFSFVNTLLLRPPPVENPDELWQIWQLRPKASSAMKRYGVWGPAEIAFLREHNRTFADLGAFQIEPNATSWNHNGTGQPVQSLFVSGNYFDLCGIRPALGRFFLPTEDEIPGTHPVVVVSHAFWRNRLAADPQALGRALTINGVALTLVGVAPEHFTGTSAGIAPDLWVPFMMVPEVSHDERWLTRTDSHSVVGFGRLKPGVQESQAAADLTALTHRFQEEFKGKKPEDDAALTPSLMVPVPLRGFVRAFTATLMGAVFLVLLIACANAANLQLARAVGRRQEMAVRSAMGATPGRLIRQLIVESLLLATMGGVLGLMLSVWLAQLILSLMPAVLPLRLDIALDWRVLTFTAVMSMGTGLFFGLVPAFRGTGLHAASALKDEMRGSAARRSRLSQALIVGQMAICLVLLLAATLCLRSLANARSLDPGFEVRNRVRASLNLSDFGYSPTASRDFYARLLSRVQSMPGVLSVAWTGFLPLGTEVSNGTFELDGREPGSGGSGFFEKFTVSPGAFTALGTTLLQGRDFTEADDENAPRVVIINEAAATRYWPGENPIGRYLGNVHSGNAREIIGVVQTGRYRTLGEDPKPAFFDCFLQDVPTRATLVAHVQGDPQRALSAIRDSVQALDGRLALISAGTMEQHLTLALFPVRTTGMLLGALGVVGVVLAVSGLFGVIAYSVSQRTLEVGIRMALGAQSRQVRHLVQRQGMTLAVIGVGVGLLIAFGVTQLLRNLLFGVSPTDPATFIVTPLLLLLVAWMACWLPARRASQVNPMVALRSE